MEIIVCITTVHSEMEQASPISLTAAQIRDTPVISENISQSMDAMRASIMRVECRTSHVMLVTSYIVLICRIVFYTAFCIVSLLCLCVGEVSVEDFLCNYKS